MSNRLAARAAWISSSSLTPVAGCASFEDVPGTPNGFSPDVIGSLLGKDDVEGHNQRQCHAAKEGRRAPPEFVTGIFVDFGFLGPGQSPHQPPKLLGGLRLGEQRDNDQYHPT